MFNIRVVNCDFESSNEVDLPDSEHARNHALRAALGIGTDELCKGIPFFGAEIRIEHHGQAPERIMVAMGASPLK